MRELRGEAVHRAHLQAHEQLDAPLGLPGEESSLQRAHLKLRVVAHGTRRSFQMKHYPRDMLFWGEKDVTHMEKLSGLKDVVALLSKHESYAKMDAQVTDHASIVTYRGGLRMEDLFCYLIRVSL